MPLKSHHFASNGEHYDSDLVDFDLVRLEKDVEQILLGWDNWDEGEIKCSESTMTRVENLMGVKFSLGEPKNMTPGVIDIYLKPSDDEK